MRLIRATLQVPQRCTMAHSPSGRTQMAMGSIPPPHGDRRSPGLSSTCLLHKQFGQWLRCRVPDALPSIVSLQRRQKKSSEAPSRRPRRSLGVNGSRFTHRNGAQGELAKRDHRRHSLHRPFGLPKQYAHRLRAGVLGRARTGFSESCLTQRRATRWWRFEQVPCFSLGSDVRCKFLRSCRVRQEL